MLASVVQSVRACLNVVGTGHEDGWMGFSVSFSGRLLIELGNSVERDGSVRYEAGRERQILTTIPRGMMESWGLMEKEDH